MPEKNRTIFEIIKISFLFPIATIERILSKYKDLNNSGKKPKYVFCAGRKHYSDLKKKFKNSKIIKIPSFDCDEKIKAFKKALNNTWFNLSDSFKFKHNFKRKNK